MPTDLTRLRIGYTPISRNLMHPGDRRRFMAYARSRDLNVELADPAKSYDLVVVTERGDLTTWSSYGKGRAKVIFDMPDSYHAIPRTDVAALLRGVAKFVTRESARLQLNYWATLDRMCRRADAVVCSTDAQQQHILESCPNVHIILDLQGDVVRHCKENYAAGDVFNLVWEGLPENTAFLSEIAEPLRYLRSKYTVALHVMTDLEYYRFMARYGKRHTQNRVRGIFENSFVYEWNPIMFSAIITQCDLALIPLPLDRPLGSGKPENKLVLFWRMGMPVVTSATPAYVNTMREAGLDMQCTTVDDWKRVLEHYLLNEEARAVAGRRGKVFADTKRSQADLLRRWDRLMWSLFPDVRIPGLSA